MVRYVVNFHGSLLPKYRGRTPLLWFVINEERYCGITAHLMNGECDDGDITKTNKIRIRYKDTGVGLLTKYNELYPTLVNQVIDLIETNNITTIKQD